jgi:hypothetical protein
MNMVNGILFGEIAGDKAATATGYQLLANWLSYSQTADLHEFSSATYYWVQINALYMGYLYAKRPGARAVFGAILDHTWSDVCANYFQPTQVLSGPHARDYDFLYGHGALGVHMYAQGLPGMSHMVCPTWCAPWYVPHGVLLLASLVCPTWCAPWYVPHGVLSSLVCPTWCAPWYVPHGVLPGMSHMVCEKADAHCERSDNEQNVFALLNLLHQPQQLGMSTRRTNEGENGTSALANGTTDSAPSTTSPTTSPTSTTNSPSATSPLKTLGGLGGLDYHVISWTQRYTGYVLPTAVYNLTMAPTREISSLHWPGGDG